MLAAPYFTSLCASIQDLNARSLSSRIPVQIPKQSCLRSKICARENKNAALKSKIARARQKINLMIFFSFAEKKAVRSWTLKRTVSSASEKNAKMCQEAKQIFELYSVSQL